MESEKFIKITENLKMKEEILINFKRLTEESVNHQTMSPSVATITALMVCMRFSA